MGKLKATGVMIPHDNQYIHALFLCNGKLTGSYDLQMEKGTPRYGSLVYDAIDNSPTLQSTGLPYHHRQPRNNANYSTQCAIIPGPEPRYTAEITHEYHDSTPELNPKTALHAITVTLVRYQGDNRYHVNIQKDKIKEYNSMLEVGQQLSKKRHPKHSSSASPEPVEIKQVIYHEIAKSLGTTCLKAVCTLYKASISSSQLTPEFVEASPEINADEDGLARVTRLCQQSGQSVSDLIAKIDDLRQNWTECPLNFPKCLALASLYRATQVTQGTAEQQAHPALFTPTQHRSSLFAQGSDTAEDTVPVAMSSPPSSVSIDTMSTAAPDNDSDRHTLQDAAGSALSREAPSSNEEALLDAEKLCRDNRSYAILKKEGSRKNYKVSSAHFANIPNISEFTIIPCDTRHVPHSLSLCVSWPAGSYELEPARDGKHKPDASQQYVEPVMESELMRPGDSPYHNKKTITPDNTQIITESEANTTITNRNKSPLIYDVRVTHTRYTTTPQINPGHKKIPMVIVLITENPETGQYTCTLRKMKLANEGNPINPRAILTIESATLRHNSAVKPAQLKMGLYVGNTDIAMHRPSYVMHETRTLSSCMTPAFIETLNLNTAEGSVPNKVPCSSGTIVGVHSALRRMMPLNQNYPENFKTLFPGCCHFITLLQNENRLMDESMRQRDEFASQEDSSPAKNIEENRAESSLSHTGYMGTIQQQSDICYASDPPEFIAGTPVVDNRPAKTLETVSLTATTATRESARQFGKNEERGYAVGGQ